MILKYLQKKEWALAVLCVLLIALQVGLELQIPGYMSEITLLIQTGGTVSEVLTQGYWMIACSFGSLIAAIITGYTAAYIAASLSKRLRKLEFDKVETYSMNEINKFSASSLITRSTNDITQIQMTVAMGLQVVIRAPIMAVWALTKILGKSWQWTAATGVAVMVIIAAIVLVMVFVVPRFKKIQWLTDNLNRVTEENLSGVRVVRAYNAEDYQEEKFDRANEELTATNLFTSRAMALMMPGLTLTMSLLSLSIYWIGAVIIAASGNIQTQMTLFSDMVVFSAYAMQIIGAFMMTVVIMNILPRAMVAAKRVEEVINTESSIKDGTVTVSPAGKEGEITFKNVGFGYPGAADMILKDINIDVKKGETVAFIGSTGCGKSTLINLIPRFYDATSGEVLVDGIDVRDYTLKALHRKIGYVPQRSMMFTGTVDYNVRYGDTSEERTEEDVKKAVEIAQGKEFVEKMEDGYGSEISQGGTNLSGGQKQRISIARAVCRKPEIYIFDDSFSALDYRTDRVLREALKKETSGVTTLIVSQRIGTIMEADKIVVMEEGKIAGIGRHSDLLKNCPVYHEIAASQLTAEEMGE